MLSKERAEFMVDVLQKELFSLERIKEYVSVQGVDISKDKKVMSRMTTIKRNLRLYKSKLIKMINEGVDFLLDDVNLPDTLMCEKNSQYDNTPKYDSNINNMENNKIRTIKIKNYR